jgi:hypothetical protein
MRRGLWRSAILFPCAAAVGIWCGGPISGKILAIVVPVVAAAMGYGLWNGVRRGRASWNSFQVTISDDAITRRVAFLPDFVLTRDSIVEITQNRRCDIAIRGRGLTKVIGVAADLDGLDEFCAMLAAWQPIKRRQPLLGGNAGLLAGVATVAAYAGTFISRNPLIVVPAGLIIGVGLLYCAWFFWRSPHSDRRFRWWILIVILIAMSAFVRVYQVLHS